jgi:Fis family transcriptional regulator
MPSSCEPLSLSDTVEQAVRAYFEAMGEEDMTRLYKTVLEQVEPPLLRVVLQRTGGNRTHAARILGINRNTLLKKITYYQLTHIQE